MRVADISAVFAQSLYERLGALLAELRNRCPGIYMSSRGLVYVSGRGCILFMTS